MKKIAVDIKKKVDIMAGGVKVGGITYSFQRLPNNRGVVMFVDAHNQIGHNILAHIGSKPLYGIRSAKRTIDNLPNAVNIVAQHISKVNKRGLLPLDGVPFVENPAPGMSSHYRIDKQLP